MESLSRTTRTIVIAAAVAGAAFALTACGGGSESTATTTTQNQSAIDAQVQEALGGEAIAVTAPGTYTAGTDVASGIWGPDAKNKKFFTTDDVKALTVNGIPAQIYQPTDTASGDLRVTFQNPPATTGIGGDGYQRSDGSWDLSFQLPPGQTMTVAAPLSTPLRLYIG